MSDCSCEGFTEVVKAGLLEGFFFFLPKESGSRSETKRVKRWMARVQELVTSCLISGPLGLYVRSCLAPPRISHCEKKGGGKSFKVPGSIEENMRLCPNKHTFLLVLTCISKSLMRCSWKQIRYTCKRSYAHRKVCRHKRTHKHTGWCLMLIICFPSPAFLRGPACSALDMLKLVEMIDCWMCRTKYWPLLCLIRQLYSSPLRAKDWKVKRG